LNKDEAELKRGIEHLREARGSYRPEGWVYYGIQDFVLQHGVWHRPSNAKIPERGVKKLGFANALWLALIYSYRYIEGYAITDEVRSPVHHAWNLNQDGNLVDSTWDGGVAYLGVEFATCRATKIIHAGDTVLDNWPDGFSHYRQRWTDELRRSATAG
jgi:hypothetical protein